MTLQHTPALGLKRGGGRRGIGAVAWADAAAHADGHSDGVALACCVVMAKVAAAAMVQLGLLLRCWRCGGGRTERCERRDAGQDSVRWIRVSMTQEILVINRKLAP